ncbi:MAG TPA: hypothetical protein VF621_13470 [Pyrinomonadaceae bacterium]
MRHRLKLTLALAALQLFAALPADARGAGRGPAAAGRRASMTQGRTKGVRRRAPETLTPGVWGGEHIRFEVTETGANVEYDCAHGTVEGKIVVDGQGRFNAYGLHYEEHGGPVRLGGEAAGYRVRLSGRVGGSLMKLTVTRPGTRKVLGTFNLARDREPALVKCR